MLNGRLRRFAAFLTAVFMAVWVTGSAYPHAERQSMPAAAAAEIHGIDISKYQETIDWQTLAQSEIKFVIMRCCKVIRAYNDWEVDSTFEANYAAAKAAGLAVGCYMFTDAATTEEFEQDVSYMLTFLKDKSFEFPVFLDMESASRQEHLSPSVFMPALLTGLEQIEDAGHTAGVYSSSAFFNECIDRKQLQQAGYAIWEANYFNSINGLASPAGHDLSGEATIWQYSGCGRAPGIKTTVDRNICYTYQYFNHAAVLVNSMLPNGILRPGSNFTIAGTVTSESVIRTITGAIYDLNNPAEPVQTVTVYPHAREYKLTGFFTKKLVFSTLSEGEYELRITAVDASDSPFTVAESQFLISNDDNAVMTPHPDLEFGDPLDDPAVPAIAQPIPYQRQEIPKLRGHFGMRFSHWAAGHWSVRKMSNAMTRLCTRCKLERTPFFRINASLCYLIELRHLIASARLCHCAKAQTA